VVSLADWFAHLALNLVADHRSPCGLLLQTFRINIALPSKSEVLVHFLAFSLSESLVPVHLPRLSSSSYRTNGHNLEPERVPGSATAFFFFFFETTCESRVKDHFIIHSFIYNGTQPRFSTGCFGLPVPY
jgi:hypothetical protein